jgi:hypothetical protein
MRPAIHRIGETLGWCGAALLVALSLPFVALTVVLLRTVFVAAAALVILGAIGLFCVRSPFQARLTQKASH